MTDINPGDYVKFRRIVTPAKKQRIRDASGGNHDALLEEREIINQPGAGLVLSVAKLPLTLYGVKVRTGKVDAGPWLKTVVAVLNDAEVVGQQMSMVLAYNDRVTRGAGMYGTDAKGGA